MGFCFALWSRSHERKLFFYFIMWNCPKVNVYLQKKIYQQASVDTLYFGLQVKLDVECIWFGPDPFAPVGLSSI